MTVSHIPYVMRDWHGKQTRDRKRELHDLSDAELKMRLRRLDHEYGFVPTEEAGKPLISEMERIQDELTRRKESRS